LWEWGATVQVSRLGSQLVSHHTGAIADQAIDCNRENTGTVETQHVGNVVCQEFDGEAWV
jgi:hypothetical protein